MKRTVLKAAALLFTTIVCFGAVVTASGKGTEEKTYTLKSGKFATLEGYDYKKAAAKSKAVKNSYFDDAVFIGDSRTVDLMLFSPLGKTKARQYCDVGLSVGNLQKKYFVPENGKLIDPITAMKKHPKFNKVYIMFGLNELGYVSGEGFLKDYNKLVDNIRAANKNAVIYAHCILPVSHRKDGNDKIYTIDRVKRFNGYIKKAAEDKKLVYIDAYEEFTTYTGYLPDDAAPDGIHFGAKYCEGWFEYLKTHTVKYKKAKK